MYSQKMYLQKVPINIEGVNYFFDLSEYELTKPTQWLYASLSRVYKAAFFQTEINENVAKSAIIPEEIKELKKHHILLNERPSPPPTKLLTRELADLVINVSQICNMGCKYCCVGNGEFGKQPTYLTIEKSRTALNELMSRTTSRRHTITFFGGEPLLNYPIIHDTILFAHSLAEKYDREFFFRILTNGTAFSEENAKFLINNDVQIQISIDGSETAHDRWRVFRDGHPTFKYILKAIDRYFYNAKQLVTLRATMTKGNLNALTVYQAIRGMGFSRIIIAHANGRHEASSYSEVEMQELRDGYTQLAEYFLEQAINHESIDMVGAPFNDHIRTLANGERKESYCGAGLHFVSLSARGEYYFCPDLAENPFAIAGNTSSGLNKNAVSACLEIIASVDRKTKCSLCWARYVCGGGCAALALSENGNIFLPYEPDCELIRYNISLALWIMHQLQEQCPRAFFVWFDNPSLLSHSYASQELAQS
jgi:uncharacterized protein